MDRFIKKITLSGVDNSVLDINSLIQLSKEFPFLEYAILYDENYTGMPRYPSINWIDMLKDLPVMSMAGHLCGDYVKSFLKGEWVLDDIISSSLLEKFGRWQINTQGIPYDADIPKALLIVERLKSFGQKVILQYDGTNAEMIKAFFNEANEPLFDNIEILNDALKFDGNGKDSWPILPYHCLMGYTGGFNISNIDRLDMLRNTIGKQEGLIPEIWISVEAGVRSDSDTVFNMEYAKRFLERASEYVCG